MTMHVAKKQYLMVSVALLSKHLSIVNSGVEKLWRIWPSSVKVDSKRIASVVALDNPVWVQHRNYFKDKCFSQQLSFLVMLLQKKVYSSLNYERSVAFSRMDSWCQKYNLLVHIGFMNIFCDWYYKARVFVNCIAQFLHFKVILEKVSLMLILLKEQVVFEIGKSVWLEVWEEDDIVIILKGIGEA